MTDTPRPLVVSEIFGPTLQGEGPSAGTPCVFLRLGGCNLSCRWCDTPYTWDWTGISDEARERGEGWRARDELSPRPVPVVAAQLTAAAGDAVRLLVVSGGEPLQQGDRLAPLVDHLGDAWQVEVETNGTLPPPDDLLERVTRWNVSPKLAHSGDPAHQRINPPVLHGFTRHDAVFKFVASTAGHLAEIDSICQQAGIPEHMVWVMPEGRTPDRVTASTQAIADAVVGYGWRLTTRLHVYAWGDKRGH